MGTSEYYLPNLILSIESSGEWVNTYTIDSSWNFIDNEGHGHFVSTGNGKNTLDTLEKAYRGCDNYDHDEDCQGAMYWQCKICKEEISPRFREGTEFIAGKDRYTIEAYSGDTRIVYKFGFKEFQRVKEAIFNSLKETLGDEFIYEVTIESR